MPPELEGTVPTLSSYPVYELLYPPHQPFTVVIAAAPLSGAAPLSVDFSASISGGENPYTYLWNFDDGGTSTSANPTHDFATAGVYVVTLTVRDDLGYLAKATLSILAIASGTPYFTPSKHVRFG